MNNKLQLDAEFGPIMLVYTEKCSNGLNRYIINNYIHKVNEKLMYILTYICTQRSYKLNIKINLKPSV